MGGEGSGRRPGFMRPMTVQILALSDEGLATSDIAKRVGCTVSNVRHVRTKLWTPCAGPCGQCRIRPREPGSMVCAKCLERREARVSEAKGQRCRCGLLLPCHGCVSVVEAALTRVEV